MNILFVCRANVGRSQIAEAIFNKLSDTHTASSAGTKVTGNNGFDGQTLKDFITIMPSAEHVITVLREEGLDALHNKRTQLTEEMLNKFDIIVVLAKREECPDYLLNSEKTVFWDVDDAKGTDYAFHLRIKEEIKKLIQDFLNKESS